MTKLLLLTALVVCCFSSAFAQESKFANTETKPRLLEVEKKSSSMSMQERFAQLEGTFQIQTSKEEYSLLITEDLLLTIEYGRKQNEAISIKWGDFSMIYLPSLSQINQSDYIPLQTVKYVGN